MTEADNTRTMKLEESTLQKAMSGSEAAQKLQEKHPRCPECGEKSYLHISGIDSQEYKCRGEGHEFTVRTKEIFSERELKNLLLDNLETTSEIDDLREHATFNLGRKVKQVEDPQDGKKWYFNSLNGEEIERDVIVQKWLTIHQRNGEIEMSPKMDEFTAAIENNPYFDFFVYSNRVEVVEVPKRVVEEVRE